ncbi:glycoside hydrolase family 78 protein [Echinicola pacifica]|nr:glycoside hydrolase family 78 protein [Echinicola pacifica]
MNTCRLLATCKTPLSILTILLLMAMGGIACDSERGLATWTSYELRVERQIDPLALETRRPRFSWKLHSPEQGAYQSAYQLEVYQGKTAEAEKMIWDSGKIPEGQSQLLPYLGPPLSPGNDYCWRLKVWNDKEQASQWSELSFFGMAPAELSLQSQWIGAITRADSHLPEGRDYHAPLMGKQENKDKWGKVDSLASRSILLRKEFAVTDKLKKAKIHISGLGHYELSINGHKVGNSVFAPLWTDYDKTVYYNTFEVSEQLNKGDNAIGVLLGNGMYNITGGRYFKFLVSFGPPTLFFRMDLEYQDGRKESISSDASWKWDKSPIRYNSIFGGEDYDARLEQAGWDEAGFDASDWKAAQVQQAPKGRLGPQQASSVRVQEEYGIQTITEPQENVYIMDMGQNLAGFPSLKVKGSRGQKIRLIVGEHLKEDGLVGQGRTGGPHYYEYTLKGEGEESWTPRFSYYGYQYIQIENVNLPGQPEKPGRPGVLELKSNFIYNDVAEIGTFESSNEIFNKSHVLINNAIKSNMQSVFTDCPHREKLGWLEETHLNGPGLFFNYDLGLLVPKVMQDMADAQWENGLVPNIAPEYVIFGGDFTDSPEWGMAAIILPWMYYDYYGDSSLIERHYPMMKRYIEYLGTKATNHILSHGLGDWYDYGPHAAGYSKNSPISLSATSHYYFGIKLLKDAASMLQEEADYDRYRQLQTEVKEAFNGEFFDTRSNQYGTGSQFSNAIPLFLDMVDSSRREKVLNNLVANIHENGNRLTTGDVGNRYLYQTLARNGLNELMFKMHNHYDTPGYGFQIQFGLTTLTEQWDPRKGNSWNHFMMGQIEEWFFTDLAGIQVDRMNPGFKHFFLRPQLLGDMDYVKASYESIYGTIHSAWQREKDKLTFHFTIPVNSTATFVMPVSHPAEVLINGREAGDRDAKDNNAKPLPHSYALGSGEYSIEVRL